MEDTLGAEEVVMSFMSSNVLILVLMEDTLGDVRMHSLRRRVL